MLKDLFQLKRLEKDFEIIEGLKVTLHTLSLEEQSAALRNLPDINKDPASWLLAQHKNTLVYATSSINGQTHSTEELSKLYSGLQTVVIEEMFARYSELDNEQKSLFEDLKKK